MMAHAVADAARPRAVLTCRRVKEAAAGERAGPEELAPPARDRAQARQPRLLAGDGIPDLCGPLRDRPLRPAIQHRYRRL